MFGDGPFGRGCAKAVRACGREMVVDELVLVRLRRAVVVMNHGVKVWCSGEEKIGV